MDIVNDILKLAVLPALYGLWRLAVLLTELKKDMALVKEHIRALCGAAGVDCTIPEVKKS